MQHLFVIDPLGHLLPEADTTIAFMREAARRGQEVWSCELPDLGLGADGRARATVTEVELLPEGEDNWYRTGRRERRYLDSFSVVWMRKDPPFDMDFLYATHLLSMVRESTLVVNDPASLRNANEKLFANRFPEFCPDTRVSCSMEELLEFQREVGGEMIIKPLDGAGGEGIFYLGPGDRNARSILETSTRHGRRYIMAQRYIPEVRQGDKRIIVVEGEPLGAVLRVPHDSDARANFHAGGTAQHADITEREREICAAIGPTLREMGIVFAGIDVIGAWLTEINVTSPTGIREIHALDGISLEADILDAVEKRFAARQ